MFDVRCLKFVENSKIRKNLLKFLEISEKYINRLIQFCVCVCFKNRTGSVGLLSEDAPEDADQVNLITKVDSIKDDVVYQVAYAADEAEGLLTCLFFFSFVCCFFLVFCCFFF